LGNAEIWKSIIAEWNKIPLSYAGMSKLKRGVNLKKEKKRARARALSRLNLSRGRICEVLRHSAG
jgi:hypothetical protein